MPVNEIRVTDAFYSKGSKPYQNIRSNIDAWNTQIQCCNDFYGFNKNFHIIMGGLKTEMNEYRRLHTGKDLDDRMLTRLKIFNRFDILYNRLKKGIYYKAAGLQTRYIEKYVHAKLAETIKSGKPEDAELAKSVLLNPDEIEKRVDALLWKDAGKNLREMMPKSNMDLTIAVRSNGQKLMQSLDKIMGNDAPSVLRCTEVKKAPKTTVEQKVSAVSFT